MSICLAESAIGIRGPIMYVIVGRVKKSDQVFRPVAFRSDFTLLPPGIAAGEATVVAAEEMFAPYDKRRPRKGALLTLSFPPDEFDVNNPEHQQRVLELAYELAKRVAPNSPCVVGVHADKAHLHAHVFILNHDMTTLKALRKGFVYSDVKSINDELMEENGLRVAEPGEVSKTKESVWLRRRGVEIPEHTGLDHLGVTEENWQAWVRDEVDRVLDDDGVDSMAVFKKQMRARGVDVRYKKPNKTNPNHAVSFAVLDDAGRVRRFESSGGKTYKMSRAGSVLGTDYTYQAIEGSITDRQKEIQNGPSRATEEVARASIAAAGTGTGADAGRGGTAVPGVDAGATAVVGTGRGGADVDAAAGEGSAAAGEARRGGSAGPDGAAGEGTGPGGAGAGRGAASGRGREAGSPAGVDTRGALNASIERKAARHRTKTDQWIDTVAERVEDRLDRDVEVAARRISQSQSVMEGLAWLLVLYMEQRQQTAELREWASAKRDAMDAPVERPTSGPLAALSDDALRFLSTHEEGAARGYEQFAEEKYSAYVDRKRARGEEPRSMADYYGVSWGDAVQAARGEAAVGGSLPVPARDFLLDTGHFDRFIAWRASTDRRAWSQPLKAEDIAEMEAPVAAAAQGCPEFVRYIATHGQLDAYAQRAKVLRDVRHATDDFYARTGDEAAEQRARDQRLVGESVPKTTKTTTTGFVD
ncbi:relaxase/mobilization nuclease domain-containing protein [Gordonia sp. FQ]|uniref:relaxase/mobilization nuclease domain-containing protein n=1 Tax=Gordonia sp. FQ TaxID=3446634 RepID=UPI003F8495FE